MADAPVIDVIGLRALVRDLVRSSDPRAGALVKAMQDAGRKAAEPIAAAARASLPHDTGTLAGDVRVTASRTGAAVRMGRSSIRYAGWIEFGGTRHEPHDSSRDYIADGRYLFPAARSEQPGAVDAYTSALQHAFDNLDWTNTTSDPTAVHD
jgi:hypothetical protein